MNSHKSSRFLKSTVDYPIRNAYQYWVSGRGWFPFDMLRYDNAWPATSSDAALLCENNAAPRSVQIMSNREPTIGRWTSFGWSVGMEKLYPVAEESKMRLTAEQERSLELLIDASCLSAVVEALSNIAFEKVDHIRHSWQDGKQDNVSAESWGKDASRLHTLVGELEN